MKQAAMEEVGLTEEEYRGISTHLFREAALLDQGKFELWLGTISRAIRYRLSAPAVANWRTTHKAMPPEILLMDETFASLCMRVEQFSNHNYTIAENPRSITCRHVSNVIVETILENGAVQVSSNVLIYRTRGILTEPPHILSLTRSDKFERQGDKYQLTMRNAMLSSSAVLTGNLTGLF